MLTSLFFTVVASFAEYEVAQPLPTFALPGTSFVNPSFGNRVVLSAEAGSTIDKANACDHCRTAISVPVSIGKLGQGELLQLQGEACGVTGNCGFVLVTHQGGRRHLYSVGYGWSFSLTPTRAGVPALYMQANMSCCSGIIQRFTWQHGTDH